MVHAQVRKNDEIEEFLLQEWKQIKYLLEDMKCIRKAETVDRRNNVEIILAFLWIMYFTCLIVCLPYKDCLMEAEDRIRSLFWLENMV